MKRYSVLELIRETDKVHGVFEAATESVHTAFCEVRSVGRSEVYSAMAIGYNVSVVFVLALDAEYNGEKSLNFEGKRYKVVRTYVSDDGIELTCEVSNG